MATLKVNRGTTYSRTITYYKDGVLTPLTGMTVFFTMKSAEYDADATDTAALVSKTYTSLTGTEAAAGRAAITLLPTDTSAIAPGSYFYDIKVKESATVIYKVDEGTIKLDASPTNRTS